MAFGRTNDYVETPAASVTPEEMEQTFYSALSRNTFIEGNITTKDDLVFSAGLKGNISSTKIVHVDNGVIEGMIDVGEIDIDNGKIKGDIVSNGAVNVDNLSLIIGDVRGQDIICDGKIKGDLYIENSCTINANAVIFGNIKAAVINIDSGAVIKGTIEVVRQSIASTNLFDFEEQFMDMSDFAKTTLE